MVGVWGQGRVVVGGRGRGVVGLGGRGLAVVEVGGRGRVVEGVEGLGRGREGRGLDGGRVGVWWRVWGVVVVAGAGRLGERGVVVGVGARVAVGIGGRGRGGLWGAGGRVGEVKNMRLRQP